MTSPRPLRGGCHCGRNRYVLAIPQESITEATVLFNTEPDHQIPLATPLAAYLRVPLTWYHATTTALYSDEIPSIIRRVYTHPDQQHAKRHFCGFCGTPLSYWSESPPSEAEYIHLTLGSLFREDLRGLEDMGLIPEEEDGRSQDQTQPLSDGTIDSSTRLKESYGVPWFEGMVEGTRLGRMRHSQGVRRYQDGRVKVEWEIVEYSGEDNDISGDQIRDVDMESTHHGKRKLQDRDDEEIAV